jgi:plasmid maintenance system antidote protein VapI
MTTQIKKPKKTSRIKTISRFESLKEETEPGLTLRKNRLTEGLTQQELADAIGIFSHHVSEMENGKRPIGKEMAKRLAEYFKTDYRMFL